VGFLRVILCAIESRVRVIQHDQRGVGKIIEYGFLLFVKKPLQVFDARRQVPPGDGLANRVEI